MSWFHIGHPCISPSVVCLFIFLFPNYKSEYRWIFTKLSTACAFILRRSGLVLLMGKLCHFMDRDISLQCDSGWVLFNVFIVVHVYFSEKIRLDIS